MAIFGQNSAFLVSLTIYIEINAQMGYQNDALDYKNNLQPQKFILG